MAFNTLQDIYRNPPPSVWGGSPTAPQMSGGYAPVAAPQIGSPDPPAGSLGLPEAGTPAPTNADLMNPNVSPTGYGGTGGWYWSGGDANPNQGWIKTDWQQPQSMGGFLNSGLDWHNDIAPGLTFVGGTLGAAALGGGLLGDTAGGTVGGTAEGGVAGGGIGTGAGAGAGAGAGVAAPTLGQVGTAASLATAANALGNSQDVSPPLSATQDPLGSGGDPGNAAPRTGGGLSGSALSRIIDGTATTADYLSVMGGAAGTGLGIAGSISQQNALKDLASKQMAMGAPYRDRLASLYADPNSFLKSTEVTAPVQQGTDALARSLSVQGNPIGSGHALQELQNYSANQLFGKLGQEKDRLAGYGGLTAYNAAAPGTALAGVNAGSNVWNAVGSGISNLTNPQPSLIDLYKTMKGLA